MTQLIDWRHSSPDQTSEILTCIREGGLVVLPTDSCYGLACDAFNPSAIARLRQVKRMHPATPLTALVAGSDVADALSTDVPAYGRAIMDAYWPGLVTLRLRAQPSVKCDLGDNGRIDLRVPNHEGLRQLLRAAGPMAVSQASTIGCSPPFTLDAAMASLGSQIDLAVEAGDLQSVGLSTFVDCTGERLALLRAGPITITQLLNVEAADRATDLSPD